MVSESDARSNPNLKSNLNLKSTANAKEPAAEKDEGSQLGSSAGDNSIGITQLAIDHIFNAISVEEKGKFLVTASYLQVFHYRCLPFRGSKKV